MTKMLHFMFYSVLAFTNLAGCRKLLSKLKLGKGLVNPTDTPKSVFLFAINN